MLFSKVKILFFGKGVNDFIYFFFCQEKVLHRFGKNDIIEVYLNFIRNSNASA
ncbi:hypothetical protein VPHK408_0004 [Vibrio phage K408]